MPRLLAALAVAILALALRLPYLADPLERDEGEYAYIAWRMAEGEVPYRDAFDQKPPGVFLLYRVAFALAGRSAEAVRWTAALWCAATAAAAALLGRRYGGPLAGWGAGVALAVLIASPGLWATAANTEIFMLLPLLGTLALLFSGPEGKLAQGAGRLAGAGALLAAAFLLKQIAAFFGLALLPFLLRRPRGALALAAGGAAVLGLAVLPFAAAGALGPFLDCVLLHNLRYSGEGCTAESWVTLGQVGKNLAGAFWPVLLALAGGAVSGAGAPSPLVGEGRGEGAPPVGRFLLLWLVAALASTALGCRFFPHYFLAAAPPAALLAGLGVAALGRRVHRLAAVLALLAFVAVPLAHDRHLLALSPAARSHALYGPELFPAAAPLGEYIRARTRPDETVFILGSEPQVLFHAGRKSATRYIFVYPLTWDFPDAPARQEEALAEVARARPAMVLFVRHPLSLGVAPDPRIPLIGRTVEMLRQGYALEGAVFLVPGGTRLALGPEAVAALPPEVLRRAAALLYGRVTSALAPAG